MMIGGGLIAGALLAGNGQRDFRCDATLINDDASKTELVFPKDGETGRLEQLRRQQGAVYNFVNTK